MATRLPRELCSLRATLRMRLRARDHYTSKHSHWWKRRCQSKFASHYAGGTNLVLYVKCKVDVKSTMDSYMASDKSCFKVTWTIFKDHLLEVGLTQTWQTRPCHCSEHSQQSLIYSILSCARIRMNRNSF